MVSMLFRGVGFLVLLAALAVPFRFHDAEMPLTFVSTLVVAGILLAIGQVLRPLPIARRGVPYRFRRSVR